MTESNGVPFQVLDSSPVPVQVGMEVEVYAYDDPSRRINVIPRRQDLAILDEIGKPGGGSFSIPRLDPKIQDSPDLLHWRNLVKVRLNQETVGAFLIQKKSGETVTSKEFSGDVWKVSGEGLRTWFRDATVHPYGGLRQKSAPNRVFSFASERGSWYKPGNWVPPVRVHKYTMDPNLTNPWGTAPAEWPDAPEAYWVWGTNSASSAPTGFNYFRYEFTIPESVGTRNYSVFAAGDNQLVGYMDAQEILSVEENDGWTKTWRADVELDPGQHVLAFRVLNADVSPAALIAAFFRAGDAAQETAAELLTVTGDPGWLVNAYPDPSPGWTPGEIMLTLISEAKARGVRFPDFLTPTFTAETDSNGATWSRALDWSFGIGTEYFEVIERLEEAVCDLWVNPLTLELAMYVRRGADRTLQSQAVTPVKLEVGRNVIRAREDGTSDIKNVLSVSTSDGWRSLGDSLTTSRATYGQVEGTLSTGLSTAVSGDVAQSVFDLRALPTMASTYEIIDVEGARPFVNFGVGDWILAPDAAGNLVSTRVLAISVTEENKTGHPKFAVEFGTISESRQDRHERWLRTLSNGAMGGSVANASGGGSSPSGAPSAQAPRTGPAGVAGPAGPRGPAGITWRGDWTVGASYVPRDVVAYDNSSWVALQESTAIVPAPGVHWALFAKKAPTPYEIAQANGFVGTEDQWLESLRGEQGVAGLRYLGSWASGVAYIAGDTVLFDSALWVANAPTSAGEPGSSPHWDLIMRSVGVGLPLGGLPGQTPIKASDLDGDAVWGDPFPVRQTVSFTAAAGSGSISLSATFTLLSVRYSRAARLRLYRTEQGRDADAARPVTTAYVSGRSRIYEYVSQGAEVDQERAVSGSTDSGTLVYYQVDATAPVSIDVTYLRNE